MSEIKKVRIYDRSLGESYLSAVKRDLRRAGEYYILPPNCEAKPDIEIEISSINKGGDDQYEIVGIYGETPREVEDMKELLMRRFPIDNMFITHRSKVNPEHNYANWSRQVLDFLAYMRTFEGVDFT